MKGGEAAAHPPVRGMLEDGPDVSHLRLTDVSSLPGGAETIDGPKLTPVGSRDSENDRTRRCRAAERLILSQTSRSALAAPFHLKSCSCSFDLRRFSP